LPQARMNIAPLALNTYMASARCLPISEYTQSFQRLSHPPLEESREINTAPKRGVNGDSRITNYDSHSHK
jgi:hypothetical protein